MPSSFWPSTDHDLMNELPNQSGSSTGYEHITGHEIRSKKGNVSRSWGKLKVCVFRNSNRRYSYMIADEEGPKWSKQDWISENEATAMLIVELELRGLLFDKVENVKRVQTALDGFLAHLTEQRDDASCLAAFSDWLTQEAKLTSMVRRKLPMWFGESICLRFGIRHIPQDDDGWGSIIIDGKEAFWANVDGDFDENMTALSECAESCNLILVHCHPEDEPFGTIRILLFQTVEVVKFNGQTIVLTK